MSLRRLLGISIALFAFSALAAEPSVVFDVQGGLGGNSGMPRFALYDDGQVIFLKWSGTRGKPVYLTARLPRERYAKLMASIAPEALLGLNDKYDAITATDPVANTLHVWTNGRRKTVEVAGHLWNRPDGERNPSRDKTPPEFLRAYDAILDFSAPGRRWVPKTIEAWLWPRERFREKVLPWPESWPSLARATGQQNGARLLFLPGGELAALERMDVDERRGQTFQVGERRWSMTYRMPFPREEAWNGGPR